MKRLWILVLMFPLITVGCKQEVGFAPTPNTPFQSPDVDDDDNNGPLGPLVKIMQAPSDHKLNKGTQVVFEVIPGDNALESVECYVDGEKVNCDWQRGVFDLEGLSLGKHEFAVVAIDVKGLKGDAEEVWSIYQNFVSRQDLLNVDQETQATDILFVIDNSSSMRYEQTQISERFNNFINQVDDIDWQIAITTTDDRQGPDRFWADGQLSPFPNKEYFLKSSMGKQEAQKQFSKNVHRKESGSDSEKGIYTTYRAIERSLVGRSKGDKALANFFRKEAALAVVVVSDEDESGNGLKSKGNNLLQLVKDSWGSDKIFQFNSIIVHTQQCLNGTGHTMGHKYEELSRKTNGLVGDVCAKNYSKLLTDLGKGVANLKRVHKLKCDPQDIDGDQLVDLKITSLNGKPVPGYTIDKETITFDRALKAGEYSFDYYCLEE